MNQLTDSEEENAIAELRNNMSPKEFIDRGQIVFFDIVVSFQPLSNVCSVY